MIAMSYIWQGRLLILNEIITGNNYKTSRWLNENKNKIWDTQPTCRGPADLGGSLLKDMEFADLCDGQWASMVNLAARVPVRQPPLITTSENETDTPFQ